MYIHQKITEVFSFKYQFEDKITLNTENNTEDQHF